MRSFDPLSSTPVEFNKRLDHAFTQSALTPDKKHGRNVWISNQLSGHGITASPESVRKWFAGLTTPRGDTMDALAKVIGVTAEWLEHGDSEELDEDGNPVNRDEDLRLMFDAVRDVDWSQEADHHRELDANAATAAMIAARLLFAGIDHQVAGARIMIKVGGKNLEIAVVLMSQVVNRGGIYAARLPQPASGFQHYTTSYDVLMFVLPRGGRDPLLFAVNGRAAAKLGDPESIIQIQASPDDPDPAINLRVGDELVPVDQIRDVNVLTMISM